jgi:hypothetical protein
VDLIANLFIIKQLEKVVEISRNFFIIKRPLRGITPRRKKERKKNKNIYHYVVSKMFEKVINFLFVF